MSTLDTYFTSDEPEETETKQCPAEHTYHAGTYYDIYYEEGLRRMKVCAIRN